MFTGLIRDIGKIESFNNRLLTVVSSYTPNIGDSIAINGVCLTVVSFESTKFTVEIAEETLSIVAVENFCNEVHIEPAMKLQDRLDGHILQGHIDTLGYIKSINKLHNIYEICISVDKKYLKYIVQKGSIAIDGVSLTINMVEDNTFFVGVIPHTYNNTIFSRYKINDRVNLETDIFARYIENILKYREDNVNSWENIDNILSMY